MVTDTHKYISSGKSTLQSHIRQNKCQNKNLTNSPIIPTLTNLNPGPYYTKNGLLSSTTLLIPRLSPGDKTNKPNNQALDFTISRYKPVLGEVLSKLEKTLEFINLKNDH